MRQPVGGSRINRANPVLMQRSVIAVHPGSLRRDAGAPGSVMGSGHCCGEACPPHCHSAPSHHHHPESPLGENIEPPTRGSI